MEDFLFLSETVCSSKKNFIFYLLIYFFSYPNNPADQTKRETEIVYESQ